MPRADLHIPVLFSCNKQHVARFPRRPNLKKVVVFSREELRRRRGFSRAPRFPWITLERLERSRKRSRRALGQLILRSASLWGEWVKVQTRQACSDSVPKAAKGVPLRPWCVSAEHASSRRRQRCYLYVCGSGAGAEQGACCDYE